jgi:pimeloyl-ACP methyl ester carboxylesterase
MATPTQPLSKTLRVNDLALHYLEWGRADAPPIVCVHGYTGSADAFNALARHLQARFHIIAFDVRGHGESAWSPAGAYRYEDQASDLTELAKQLGLDKFVLIGTSMGGIIAMTYAAEHGDRLLGLVINDIGPDPEAGTQRITQMVGSRPEEFATLEEAMAYRRAMSPILAARSAEDQHELALGVLQRGTGGKWKWKMDPAYIHQRVEHGPPRRPPLWPVLQALASPTLVVWGSDSDVLSEAQAGRMVDVLPRGELVRVPGIGHAPTLVEPVVLAALDRFLGGLSDQC